LHRSQCQKFPECTREDVGTGQGRRCEGAYFDKFTRIPRVGIVFDDTTLRQQGHLYGMDTRLPPEHTFDRLHATLNRNGLVRRHSALTSTHAPQVIPSILSSHLPTLPKGWFTRGSSTESGSSTLPVAGVKAESPDKKLLSFAEIEDMRARQDSRSHGESDVVRQVRKHCK